MKLGTIYIYDYFTIVISGALNSRFKTFNVEGVPTGAMYKFLNILLKDYEHMDKKKDAIVAVTEGRNSIRKAKFPDYKSNRKNNRNELNSELIQTQDKLIREMLEKLGVNLISIEGLEGDDIVYNIAKQYPDSRLVIRTVDSDLFSVTRMHSNSQVYDVNGKGLQCSSIPTGKETNQNLQDKMAIAVIDGDTADCIKPIKFDSIADKRVLYKLLVENTIPIYTENISYEWLVENRMPEKYRDALYKNIFLAQPKYIDEPIEIIPTTINNENLFKVLSLYRMKSYCKKYFKKEPDSYTYENTNKLLAIKEEIPELVLNYYISIKSYETYETQKSNGTVNKNSNLIRESKNELIWKDTISEGV